MYVDGLLAENHANPVATTLDPALAELSWTPQPPPTTDLAPVDYTAQPYWAGDPVPTDTGSYLAYLDVWTRAVTWLEDADLVDQAVAVDTTGRLQTVWQVKLIPVPAEYLVVCHAGFRHPVPGRFGWPAHHKRRHQHADRSVLPDRRHRLHGTGEPELPRGDPPGRVRQRHGEPDRRHLQVVSRQRLGQYRSDLDRHRH